MTISQEHKSRSHESEYEIRAGLGVGVGVTHGAARGRWGCGAAPTPGDTVTRAAARARARDDGTAATGSSCPPAHVHIRSLRRTSSDQISCQRLAAVEWYWTDAAQERIL